MTLYSDEEIREGANQYPGGDLSQVEKIQSEERRDFIETLRRFDGSGLPCAEIRAYISSRLGKERTPPVLDKDNLRSPND